MRDLSGWQQSIQSPCPSPATTAASPPPRCPSHFQVAVKGVSGLGAGLGVGVGQSTSQSTSTQSQTQTQIAVSGFLTLQYTKYHDTLVLSRGRYAWPRYPCQSVDLISEQSVRGNGSGWERGWERRWVGAFVDRRTRVAAWACGCAVAWGASSAGGGLGDVFGRDCAAVSDRDHALVEVAANDG